MHKDIQLFIAAIAIIIVGVLLYMFYQPSANTSFAKCLTEKGVKMYGAFWCPHCNNQKKLFGDNWQYVNYIECSTPDGNGQTQVCRDAGITGYPTWEFADGVRKMGEQSLEDLSRLSGCKITGE